MRRAGAWVTWAAALAVCVAAVHSADESQPHPQPGSDDAEPEEDETDNAPFTVIVEHAHGPPCAGSLVSLRTVVTSAACARRAGLRGRMWAVCAPAMASGSASVEESRRRVVRVAEGRGASSLDMALLELETPFPLQAEARPIVMSQDPAECATPGLVCHAVRVLYRPGKPPRLRIVDPEIVQNEKGCSTSDRALCLTGPVMCATDVGAGMVCGGKLCGALVSSSRKSDSSTEHLEPKVLGEECGEMHRATRLPRFRRFLHCAHTLRDCGRGDCIDVCSQRRLPLDDKEEKDMNESIKSIRHPPTLPVLDARNVINNSEPLSAEMAPEMAPEVSMEVTTEVSTEAPTEALAEVSAEVSVDLSEEIPSTGDPVEMLKVRANRKNAQILDERNSDKTPSDLRVSPPQRMRFLPGVMRPSSVASETRTSTISHSTESMPHLSHTTVHLTRHALHAVRQSTTAESKLPLTRAKPHVVATTTKEPEKTIRTFEVRDMIRPDRDDISMYDMDAAAVPPQSHRSLSQTTSPDEETMATKATATESSVAETTTTEEGDLLDDAHDPFGNVTKSERDVVALRSRSSMSPEQESAMIVRSFNEARPSHTIGTRSKYRQKSGCPPSFSFQQYIVTLLIIALLN